MWRVLFRVGLNPNAIGEDRVDEGVKTDKVQEETDKVQGGKGSDKRLAHPPESALYHAR